MTKVIIVHGWGGSSEANWMPWIKEALEDKGFEAITLDMPDTEHPKIKEWVSYLESKVGKPDEETHFIGHSIGCQTILRYLEKINKKVGKVILVAPWMHLDENTIKEEGEESVKISKPWMETPINFKKIKNLSNFLCIFSDDDPYVPISDTKIFRKELDAKIVIEHKQGHFNDEKYPIILNKFLEIVK